MCPFPTGIATHMLYSILKICISHKNRPLPRLLPAAVPFACAVDNCHPKKGPKKLECGKKTRDSAHVRTTESDVQFNTRRCDRKAAPLKEKTGQRRETTTPKNSLRVEGNPTPSIFARGDGRPLVQWMPSPEGGWQKSCLLLCNEARSPTMRREKNGTTWRSG